MEVGIIGLGRMGLNMCKRLLGGGHDVVAYNRSSDKVAEAVDAGSRGAASVDELVSMLKAPRVVWIMLPAGAPVEGTLSTLKGLLKEGDLIVEGGNSLYKDDLRRNEELKAIGIGYLDAGVSGGVWGLTEGYCIMVGGDREGFDRAEPLLSTLAPPDGYMYVGPSGAGHFVKMVHNGIEYAMMEAYGEGFELIERSPYGKDLDFAALSALWNRGSVIRSWLLELMEDAFKKDPELTGLEAYVEDSGEGRWTVDAGVELGVPVPAIADALFRRFRSRTSDSFGEKVLAAMRREFGGHAVKKTGE